MVGWRAVLAVAVAVLGSGCLDAQGLALAGLRADGADATSLADALLDPARFPTMAVELSVAKGAVLHKSAWLAAQTMLANLTGRTAIAYTDVLAIPAQGGPYTPDDLLGIHRRTTAFGSMTPAIGPGVVRLHVLVLDGQLGAGDGPEGRRFGTLLRSEGVIAIFPEAYADAHRAGDGGVRSAVAEVDRHVLLHELGHALGLVGRIPMVRPHEDPLHPGHSSNPGSLMHHEPPMAMDGFVHGPLGEFDSDDRADLAARRAFLAQAASGRDL